MLHDFIEVRLRPFGFGFGHVVGRSKFYIAHLTPLGQTIVGQLIGVELRDGFRRGGDLRQVIRGGEQDCFSGNFLAFAFV